MIQSILVGVDDSEGARAALHWADNLIKRQRESGTDVSATMITAWSRPTIDTQAIFDDEVFEAGAVKTLTELAETLPDPSAFEQVTRFGYPTHAIINEAEALDVDLIVVGSRGRSAIAQVILGSISRSVAAKADRPVAVIPQTGVIPRESAESPSDEDGPATGPTVIGYDDSPGARAALRWALDNLDGPIKAVSAWVLPTPVVYDPGDPELQQFRDSTEQMLHRGLKELCGGTMDPRIEPVVRHDDPRLAILGFPDAAQIVIGARAERGLKGLLLGSTVTYVATHSTSPVFIIPPAA